MSTNFYIMTIDKKFVDKYFPYEYKITDSPYFGYEIHIGKRSCGWKPLFEAHKKAYGSVEEMMEFIKLADIRIFDEYEREYNIEEFKDALITWENQQKKEMIHYDGVPGLIQTPIDHVEIMKREPNRHIPHSAYWHDKDGYDFTEGETVHYVKDFIR